MTKTEAELEKLVKPIVESLGYELYDVEFIKEGADWYLRVYIDSNKKTVDLDDCEKVSNFVSDMLDEKDPIATAYHLEISSCGMEKHLREKKHFESAIGEQVELKLYTPIEKSKLFVGKLINVTDENVTIVDEHEKETVLPFSNVSSAKILYNWEE